MAGICSDLLGISQQEFLFHVHRANQWTVAPFLSLSRSVSSLLGLTPSADLPPPPVRHCPYALSSSQLSKGQNGEQDYARSDALALPSSCPSSISDLKVEEAKEHFSVHEQGACSRGEALPQRVDQEGEGLGFVPEESMGEAWPQGEEWLGAVLGSCSEESKGDALIRDEDREDEGSGVHLSAEFARASRATCILDLDEGCLALVMARCDISTLLACSLVCRDLLAASSSARTSLSLQNSPQIAALPRLLARFYRLQTLHIKGLPISPAPTSPSDFSLIAQGCCYLRELQLHSCASFSDAGLAGILKGCPELLRFSLVHCEGFTGVGFNALHTKLEKVELDTCAGVTNEGLLALAEACSGLKELCVLTQDWDASLAQGLEGAARACGGLRAVTIHACGIVDETLRCFAESCPRLSFVSVTCERRITDAGVNGFLARLPELDTLTLQNNRGLSCIPRFGPSQQLKRLRLGWMWTMPDQVLRGIAQEVALEELVLVYCPALTDASVEKILTECKSLKNISLIFDELVTAEAVKAYIKSGSKARFHIQKCSRICKDSLGEDVLKVDKLDIHFC